MGAPPRPARGLPRERRQTRRGMMNAAAAIQTLEPLKTSRLFHAPRERVFMAWGRPDSVERWFAPPPCAITSAEVDMRVGGPFELIMRLPQGQEHRIHGVFREV